MLTLACHGKWPLSGLHHQQPVGSFVVCSARMSLLLVLCCAVLQPAKVACIEYSRDAGKDEQYPWVCLWKAVSVSDSILGARAQVGGWFGAAFIQLTAFQTCSKAVSGSKSGHKGTGWWVGGWASGWVCRAVPQLPCLRPATAHGCAQAYGLQCSAGPKPTGRWTVGWWCCAALWPPRALLALMLAALHC